MALWGSAFTHEITTRNIIIKVYIDKAMSNTFARAIRKLLRTNIGTPNSFK
jgi:hypothetical protein